MLLRIEKTKAEDEPFSLKTWRPLRRMMRMVSLEGCGHKLDCVLEKIRREEVDVARINFTI